LRPETPRVAETNDANLLGPQRAAALLRETTRQARRQFEPSAPWFLAARAFPVLVVYGAVWLSVRGQHPYRHPTVAAIPGVVGFVVLNLGATLIVARRANAGVRGRSRLHRGEIAVMAVTWVGVFVVMGILPGVGVSGSVVYGLYPAGVALIAAGLVWAAIMARRASWRPFTSAVAVAVVGCVALLAGPAGAWAVAGVGLFVVLLGSAATVAWRQRR
jgi:hypothetical protein